MALKDILFGFNFGRTPQEKKEEDKNKSFVAPTNDDGAVIVQGGLQGTYIDIDGTIKNEFELITRYREMSLNPELDMAIDEVCNEAVVVSDEEPVVKLDLSNLDTELVSKKIQLRMQEEFQEVLKLLDFNNQAYEIFRKWYVDGRLYYHAVVTEGSEKEGIKEVRYIDPRQIRKIREIDRQVDDNGVEIVKVVDEYYAYNARGIQYPGGAPNSNPVGGGSVTGIKISKDAVVHVHSGITDRYSSTILSHLHKSIRPLNQLKMMEDASVIYRITRAPERRIFYIDVQDMPKAKADQYMREMMQKYRNKIVYDQTTGEVRDDRRYQIMLEDYWLPRRNGQATTEISTLPGGANLGEIDDINYFLRKLYKSLNVPLGRLDPNNQFNVGRASEITRDEVKFSKFITRLRLRFSHLLDSLLEKQLILKNVIKKEDWPDIKNEVKYAFAKDNFFTELKETEILKERLGVLQQADQYVGKYFSADWIRKKVLRQTEDEIKDIDKKKEKEADDPVMSQPSTGAMGLDDQAKDNEPRYINGKGKGGNEVAGGADSNGAGGKNGGKDVGSI